MVSSNQERDNVYTQAASPNGSSNLEESFRPPKQWVGSTTRWFQAIMFVFFLVALIISLKVEYRELSAGLIWGAILSFISVCFVILSYTSEPAYRRHPNPLIFWRTIADFIFVSRLLAEQFVKCLFFGCKSLCRSDSFQCGCSNLGGSNTLCIIFAGVLEFSLLSAECWFVCMSINLYLSLTNPFTDFKRNTKLFHIFCWGTGLFMAVLLMSIDDLAGFSDLRLCWTNALRGAEAKDPDTCSTSDSVNSILRESENVLKANMTTWGFFYIWMLVFLLVGIVVWIWAWKRLSEGMPETYAIRVQSINRTRFYVFSVTLYWVTVLIVYVFYLTNGNNRKPTTLNEFLNFLLASKGYVDLVIWFALNDFKIPKLYAICKKNIKELDVDLNPQVNAALRKEVLFYTTSGIIQAVQAAERLPNSQRVQHLALLPQVNGDIQTSDNDTVFDETIRISRKAQRTKTFHDYEPHAFRRIRERFGVCNERYLRSLSTTAKERLSEGASGAFMFFSGDGGLIVKSTSKEECRFLRSIADQYADYLCDNPHSLLTRFYGCHCLELYGQKFSFIVMANLFDTDQVIHSRYDIKGSWVHRNADLPKRGKKVTCRHCNRKYVYQSTSYEDFNCPLRLGGHEPNVVLKDNDLTEKLRLEEDVAIELYKQLQADTDVLCTFGIMDYSLLMGVHDVEYVVGGDEAEVGTPRSSTSSGYHEDPVEFDQSMNPFSEKSVMEIAVSNVEKSNIDEAPIHSMPVKASHQSYIDPSLLTTQENPITREPRSGMRLANTVVGPAYYHLGIIDILQTWTLKKKAERFAKIVFKRVDGEGLSAVPPRSYKERFQAKMADILGVQHLVDGELRLLGNVYEQQNTHMDLEPTTSTSGVQLLRSLTTSSHLITAVEVRPSSSRSSDLHQHQPVGQRTEESSPGLRRLSRKGQPQ